MALDFKELISKLSHMDLNSAASTRKNNIGLF